MNRENRNSRETAMGRLCWTLWEVALAKVDLDSTSLIFVNGETGGGTPYMDEDQAEETVRRVKAVTSDIPASLGSESGLPENVRPFRERLLARGRDAGDILRSDLPDRASREQGKRAYERVSQVLNFKSFPGYSATERAMEDDPESCKGYYD